MDPNALWLWWTSILTLGIFTMLWKDNPYFRVVENILIGGGTAHLLIYAIIGINSTGIQAIIAGKYLLIVPLIIGILMVARISINYGWLARYPTAILVGTGIGIMLAGSIQGEIINMFAYFYTDLTGSKTLFDYVNNIAIIFVFFCMITYFIFTKEHKGPLWLTSRIGRFGFMARFGFAWGAETWWFVTTLAAGLQGMMQAILALFS